MNIRIAKRDNGGKSVTIDVTNEDAVAMKVYGRTKQTEFVYQMARTLLPNLLSSEIIILRGKRGIASNGFKSVVWVTLG